MKRQNQTQAKISRLADLTMLINCIESSLTDHDLTMPNYLMLKLDLAEYRKELNTLLATENKIEYCAVYAQELK